MRREAIVRLQLKHLKKIEEYNIFLIDVYKQARAHYYTFCTPEARKAIEEYLDWRAKVVEPYLYAKKRFNSKSSIPIRVPGAQFHTKS
jgi:hypothetical protein